MFYIKWPVGQFGFMESENKYQISNLKLHCPVVWHVSIASSRKLFVKTKPDLRLCQVLVLKQNQKPNNVNLEADSFVMLRILFDK
jgi:hypothetical protein